MSKNKMINYPEQWDEIIAKLVEINKEEKQGVTCAADIWKLALEELMKDHGFDPVPFRQESTNGRSKQFNWSLRKNYGGEIIPIEKLRAVGFVEGEHFVYDLLSDKYNFKTRRMKESATTKLREIGFKLDAAKVANQERWGNKLGGEEVGE